MKAIKLKIKHNLTTYLCPDLSLLLEILEGVSRECLSVFRIRLGFAVARILTVPVSRQLILDSRLVDKGAGIEVILPCLEENV